MTCGCKKEIKWKTWLISSFTNYLVHNILWQLTQWNRRLSLMKWSSLEMHKTIHSDNLLVKPHYSWLLEQHSVFLPQKAGKLDLLGSLALETGASLLLPTNSASTLLPQWLGSIISSPSDRCWELETALQTTNTARDRREGIYGIKAWEEIVLGSFEL